MMLTPVSSSFRDSSGHVFFENNHVLRSINEEFSAHWNEFITSGLAVNLVEQGLLLSFAEVAPLPTSWKTVQSEKLKIISYPYEWCFSQLKDAALHTLLIFKEALRRGMVLKDASAYNLQYVGTIPKFIDLLSFEKHNPSRPWVAYLQFCRHFLAPLALLSYKSGLCGRFSSLWVDGIPLELAASMLPLRSKFSPLLLIHLHWHARLQKKYDDPRSAKEKLTKLSISPGTTERLCDSLEMAVSGLGFHSPQTEWSDYYCDTNYTQTAAARKKDIVEAVAANHQGELAIDLGANTGEYSQILARHYTHVLAADIDYLAVERHYLKLKRNGGSSSITPLVFDLLNPSPAIGFANTERFSFAERYQVEMLSVLALIHHLTLSGGIPLEKSAEYFASLVKENGVLLLEFVPVEDSQIKRLLMARKLVFADYHIEGCIEAFTKYFGLQERLTIPESCRTLLVFRKLPDRH